MDVPLKPYQKRFSHSYVFGVYPTLEVLKYRHGSVFRVILANKGRENKGVKEIVSLCKKYSIKVEWSDGLIVKLGGSENSYACAFFEKYTEIIDESQNHLVLVYPSDTGNLGTILRTALAFGISNIAVIKPAVDIFDPKVIRASMGAVFNLKIEYFDYFDDYQKKHKNNYYPFLLDGSSKLYETDFVAPYSLIFGNEGAGLPKNFLKVGTSVSIPQTKKVDSVNLAVAVGLGCYTAFLSNKN